MKATAPGEAPVTWEPLGRHPLLGSCLVYRAARGDGTLTAVAGREPAGWHVSVSHPWRMPTWGELSAARSLAPDDVTMAVLFPPSSEYVNVHETCMHLWEIEDGRGC